MVIELKAMVSIVKILEIRTPEKFEPPHDKTNKMTFAPSEDSDQPGHSHSLIRVFAVHSMER